MSISSCPPTMSLLTVKSSRLSITGLLLSNALGFSSFNSAATATIPLNLSGSSIGDVIVSVPKNNSCMPASRSVTATAVSLPACLARSGSIDRTPSFSVDITLPVFCSNSLISLLDNSVCCSAACLASRRASSAASIVASAAPPGLYLLAIANCSASEGNMFLPIFLTPLPAITPAGKADTTPPKTLPAASRYLPSSTAATAPLVYMGTSASAVMGLTNSSANTMPFMAPSVELFIRRSVSTATRRVTGFSLSKYASIVSSCFSGVS